MLQTITETLELSLRPYRTREEAAQLLNALREAYQSLPLGERTLVKEVMSQTARVQFAAEID